MAGKTAAQLAAALMKAQRQKNNENTASQFAIAIVGFIAVFSLVHGIDVFLRRQQFRKHGPATVKMVSAIRGIRGFLFRKAPGFPSFGHAIVFMLYIMVNITLSFTNMWWATLNNWAKRLGWVAACNLALLTFLALKNTPLAFLTSYSYERLNILHRAAGYTTIFWSLLHAVTYISAWAKTGDLLELLETSQIMGIIAGFAMLIILASTFLRKIRYEVFYLIHVVMFMLILIVLGMHRPEIAQKALIIFLFTAAMWVSDRLTRASRMAWYTLGNNATITPLAGNSIRIVLKRSPGRVVSGSHIFLWIPGIRLAETHPFTVASTNPLELVVKAHDGFTKDLLAYAMANPSALLRASVDGPYGTLPKFGGFNHVVLIAGGSGASFTFGVVLELLMKLEGDATQALKSKIHFIWVVRENDSLSHFSRDLAPLMASSLVTLHIHTTHSRSQVLTQTIDKEKEKTDSLLPAPNFAFPRSTTPSDVIDGKISSSLHYDVEKSPQKDSSSSSVSVSSLTASLPSNIAIHIGRPDIRALITNVAAAAQDGERVIVAACGPRGLVEVSRKTVLDLLLSDSGEGPRVEFHAETFGW